MPKLVAHDVGTLPGKDRPPRGRPMEELQAPAVIEGIEVDPEIEIHRQYGAHLPRRCRKQCPPEVGAAPQYAAIRDGKLDPVASVRHLAHSQGDLALLRELAGVAQQIEQDLLE